jgi:hypothetical protein
MRVREGEEEVMIESIGRLPSEMVELQNNRQRQWVASDFAAAFRGATNESEASGELPGTAAAVSPMQKVIESASVSTGMGMAPVAGAAASVPTPTNSTAAPSYGLPNPAGWSGPPGQPGSSYNPVAAWNQVPGQQPSWISGSYPGATWTAVNEAGFLMPYSSLSPGSGEDILSGANENVIDQDWAKFYDQTDGTQAGNQIVWGANNPTDEVPAPWMAASNTLPQYTPINPSDSSQPTQPNFVAPALPST